jgi:histidinol-phosphate aminotransferase
MTEWIAGRREDDFSLDLDRARGLIEEARPHVVLLPSPNNPTGTALPPEAITALCEATGERGVVVVDEAYGEFRRAGVPSALELLPEHRNLVVTRTMSKAFAAAGLRLGYLAADPAICDAIRVVRLPYHLSAVTQAAALAAIRHAPELLGNVDQLRAQRDSRALLSPQVTHHVVRPGGDRLARLGWCHPAVVGEVHVVDEVA